MTDLRENLKEKRMIEAILTLAGLAMGLALGYVLGIRSGRSQAESLRAELEDTVEGLSLRLQTATEDMLKRRQGEFARESGDKIGQILEPLQHSIREMRDAVSVNTRNSSEMGGRLEANLHTLFAQTSAARESADRLASALRGNNQVQGQWGEVVLAELLNSQGLVEGRHFELQMVLTDASGTRVKNEHGKSMRPDVVLHLDQDRDVIIDSKVSLSAYMDYLDADDEEARRQALARHIKSIENHVDELAKKNYAVNNRGANRNAGFVIMFVPNASALALATSAKPGLWRNAMDRHVYIADDRSLYAALKIVEMTWQQIAQAENHDKVYALAQEMIDRVGRFLEFYTEVGVKLYKATESYEAGLKKLGEGRDSIPATCRKLKDLGAKGSRPLKGVSPELL